jgi:hypothetical protein
VAEQGPAPRRPRRSAPGRGGPLRHEPPSRRSDNGSRLCIATDADAKPVPSWLVGGQDSAYAGAFISDVKERLANRVQLTSDGHSLNVRMRSRRMTRLTNGLSKRIDNHPHAMAPRFMHYKFVRIHKVPRTMPAMAAGVTS